ncbi:MAG TPA: hypothetical protein VN280_22525 [Variovorax sp.]|nr:hypothetical protein [Variovorax sp.]
MAALTDLKAILIYILAALVLVLGLSTWEYRRMFKATDFALATQNDAIKARNNEANRRLVQLTNQRDALQAELDKRAAAQEKTDGKAVTQIAADDRQQRAAPVRVRVFNCTRGAGSGGGGAPGGAATGANAGAADAGAASGVLSKEGARRLADALTEIETMSAAFASCKADSFGVRGQALPGP